MAAIMSQHVSYDTDLQVNYRQQTIWKKTI